ncbi:hypothetical protein I317_06949 [Kwoniella heveanensis CBS 569]|nr:hypothetical protein I317_06949 [Kwoniella heveanensis CBS 569]
MSRNLDLRESVTGIMCDVCHSTYQSLPTAESKQNALNRFMACDRCSATNSEAVDSLGYQWARDRWDELEK